jgi:RNA polymerase sigma-70 factor (ECF subfamily)
MPLTDSAARDASSDVEPGQIRRAEVPEFSEIYKRYFTFVWSCARRLGVSEHETDDVVQEAFIVIYARLRSLEQPDSLRSWIYGIVRRTISTFHRAKRAKVASAAALTSEPEMHYPQPPSPQELAEQSDQARLLWSLLERLDPLKREVFVLVELEEMTVPEIASAIEVPLNTVYSRLRAARQEVEDALAKHNAQMPQKGRS